MKRPPKWIWEHENYGAFPYTPSFISDSLAQLTYTRGRLDQILSLMNQEAIDQVEGESIADEIMESSRIEGEFLRRESVRDSVAKLLLPALDVKHGEATRQTDALVELMVDARLNPAPMSIERLHGWHNALFAHSRGEGVRTKPITIGAFRDYDDMRVIEGAIGQTVTKYLAPPQKQMLAQIDALIAYINMDKETPCVKAALVHLWFVSIHPYDDGNGRIARALADYVLSIGGHERFVAYSISSSIAGKRDAYYETLDYTTNLHKNRHFDFGQWIAWHNRILTEAMERTIQETGFVITRTRFWDAHRQDRINPRQVKVIEHFLTSEHHKEPITNKKYMAITDAPKMMAIRDMRKLLEVGCIEKIESRSGRNTAYQLVLPDIGNNSLKERFQRGNMKE